ncbi:MAG: TIR domain-containing protein [Gammaproteobacteria bacterium]|nr:TIR domain-containing protein [Gammaproteobacteria bacterium]
MNVIANLRAQDVAEAQKESSKARDMDRAVQSLSHAKSQSTARSYHQQALRHGDELARIQKKRSDLSGKIARGTQRLHSAEQALSRELASEHQKVEVAEKKRERERLEHARRLKRELQAQRPVEILGSASAMGPTRRKEHDAFISHASEDKEKFVRPLAEALRAEEFDVWYDEFSLTVGDSLRRSIDQGLASSRYGIVVLSSAFFEKNWPQYELDGLVAKEMSGQKVILPIWHKVTKDQVLAYSPSLADKVAINSSLSSTAEIVAQLSEVLRQ